MPNPDDLVEVSYLNVGAPGSENVAIHSDGGLVAEMCPKCFALVPTDLIQQHIDQPHAGEDQTPNWEPGQNLENRPDQGFPPTSPPAPDQGLPPTSPGAPDQGLPEPPPEVSGGTPPTAGQH